MIAHLPDSADIFRDDDASLAFAVVGDRAPQIDDAVFDGHVDSRCPRLGNESRKDLIANRSVAAGWRFAGLRQTYQGPHQIGSADNADDLPSRTTGSRLMRLRSINSTAVASEASSATVTGPCVMTS
jgi:hypothetical protein